MLACRFGCDALFEGGYLSSVRTEPSGPATRAMEGLKTASGTSSDAPASRMSNDRGITFPGIGSTTWPMLLNVPDT